MYTGPPTPYQPFYPRNTDRAVPGLSRNKGPSSLLRSPRLIQRCQVAVSSCNALRYLGANNDQGGPAVLKRVWEQ